MLKIRFSLGGAKKRPVYKIVVADSRFPRDGRFIEKVGFFNPLLPKTKKERINLEVERIKHWISKGAKPNRLKLSIMKLKIQSMKRKAFPYLNRNALTNFFGFENQRGHSTG